MRRLIPGLVATLLVVAAATAAARGKSRECKPSGVPNALGTSGAVAVAQPVLYWSKPWLLVADKTVKAEKVRLLGNNGEIIELGKPPATVEPVVWLARGRAVYALGKGRSQTQGKTDVLLMRWGTDPRPRMTVLSTAEQVPGQLSAVFHDEFLAVSWAEVRDDGKAHRMVSFMDSEAPRVAPAQDLGLDVGAAARVQPVGKSFAVLWASSEGLMRASFDLHGKATSAVAKLALSNPADVRALAQCGEQSWLVLNAGNDLQLATAGASGPVANLAKLPSSHELDLLPIECVDDGIVIGHRTLNTKEGNVIFWVTTVDATGKVHDRRIKDMRGTPDDIRMPQFSVEGDKMTSWWVEGQGISAKVWSRELSCN
jgi:hypothetical protein